MIPPIEALRSLRLRPFPFDCDRWQSTRSISRLLEERWWAVALALLLTGFSAAAAALLFKTGVGWLGTWGLLAVAPAALVLPLMGGLGGLVSALLTLGGTIGLACGGLAEHLTGHVPTTFVFAGMGAFVAGCSRTPITAVVLAFALTKDLLILKPILVACLASFLVAQALHGKSIDERQIELLRAFDAAGEEEDPGPLNR